MKKLWLDLEMTGDIDDAICLLFALEHNLNVKAVSLLNPSNEELSFTRYWLDFFNQDVALFTHYDKRVKNSNKAHKLISKYSNNTYPVFNLTQITDIDNYVVIGGGSYTIPNILRDKGFDYFVLQGGFAGSNVCESPVLEKFRNKKECASWNPNLDISATKEILDFRFLRVDFISKDICHDSDIDIIFVESMRDGPTKDLLLNYFGNSGRAKKMHDVVALMFAIDSSFISMKPIIMSESKGQWSSRYSEFSRKRISVDWDKNKFLQLLIV